MMRVVSVDRYLGVGVTHPAYATLECNGYCFHAFIKLKDNPEGVLCLINELISSRIAKRLGVLTPECGVATIDDDTIDNTSYCIQEGSRGSCFFSKQIEAAVKLNGRAMPYICNKDSYEKIILFDHLIYNTDRNPGNLLLSSKKREKVLYAIDHTHVFKNQAIWDANCLRQGIMERDFNDECIIESSEGYSLFGADKPITLRTLIEEADLFEDRINEEEIDGVLGDLPYDWPIDKRNLEALKAYLLYRASHLREMCKMIVKTKGWSNV